MRVVRHAVRTAVPLGDEDVAVGDDALQRVAGGQVVGPGLGADHVDQDGIDRRAFHAGFFSVNCPDTYLCSTLAISV